MARRRFEHNRYVGDKRTQVVYDLDLADSDPDVAAAVDELLASEQASPGFATARHAGNPLAEESRNRGYRPHSGSGRGNGGVRGVTEESRRATRRSRLYEANPTVEMA